MSARVLAVVAVASVLVCGCTILNDPDKGFLDGSMRFDAAGRDAGPDADSGPGPDAGDDGGPPVRETVCNDGRDNDGDDQIDCADFDCAAAETCCSMDRPPAERERWEDTVGWARIPSSMPPTIRVGSNEIIDFGAGTTPRALARETCTPMVNGFELRAVLRPVGGGTCPAGTECYAAVVLSTVNDMAHTSHLSDELAVRLVVTSTGPELRITKAVDADPPLVVHPFAGTTEITVVIEVGPTLDELGIPSLAATVRALDMDGAPIGPDPLLDQRPFITQDRLNRTDGGCTVNPGLFLAVEGVGDEVRVGQLDMTERACANPGHFRRPSAESAILTSDRSAGGYASLQLDDWASGGIAHPALVSTLDTATTSRWDVFVDATDVERTQDVGIWDLGFAIGHTYANGTAWDSSWLDTTAPRLGDCHPSCVGPASCASMCTTGRRGFREPAAYPAVTMTTGRITALQLAYAIEDTSDAARPFSIGINPGTLPGPTGSLTGPVVRIEPGTVGCDSLREPSLVPADDLPIPEAWWLFYTCEIEGESPDIAALELNEMFTPIPGSERVVLRGEDFGAIASAGVRSPEVIVSFSTREAMPVAFFRVWATAIQGSTRRIVLATAETAGDLPVESVGGAAVAGKLAPYPDNPVLTLDDMPPCPGDWCEVLGMAVARRADKVDTLRFLVAWHVNGAASGREYQLVPLEQIWK